MTDATQTRASSNGTGGPDTDEESSGSALPTERLKEAAQTLLKAVTDKAVGAALDKVEGLTGRLTDVAENGGVGLSSALGGGAAAMQGGNPVTGALKAGASAVKDKVTGALGFGGGDDGDGDDAEGGGDGSGGGGSGGARGKFKFMNITESVDVGVPVRVVYDQWTQFADFPSFMKKLETVDQDSDEKSTWKAQVFWSHRSWETTIREQVPDSHIIWVSTGAKGHADGCVSFHELAPNMTRILLVLEYYPQGFFEKTANLWRAVGRRARLEFKHFARHVTMDTLINREELEGWRGEIRDSEVVKTHEEAMEEEQAAAEEAEDGEGGEPDGEFDDEFDEDSADESDDDLAEDDEPAATDDEFDESEDDEPEDTDSELDDDEVDEADDEFEDEESAPEPEPERPRRRARRPQRTPA